MKMLIVSLFYVLLSSSSAFAWSGPISVAELSYPPGLKEEQQKKASTVLALLQDSATFIDGYFSGPYFKSQRFGGTSGQTARLVEELLKASIWNVTLKFHSFGEQKTAFTLAFSYGNRLTISVNSDRDDFLLRDFAQYISAVHQETPSTIKAGQDGDEAQKPAAIPELKLENNQTLNLKRRGVPSSVWLAFDADRESGRF